MITKIFKSVFFTTILVLILGLGASLVISSYLDLESDSNELTQYSNSLAKALNQNKNTDLSLLGLESFRVNLIHPNGSVYFDSKVHNKILENHSNREEFEQAVKFGHSQVYRYSSTLDKRTVYYAIKLDNGDVLRCSYTTDNVFSQTISLALHLLVIVVLAIFVSMYLAKRLSLKIVEPLNQIDLSKPEDSYIYPEIIPFIKKIEAHQHRIKKLLRKVTAAHLQLNVMTSNMSEGIIFLNKKGEIISLNHGALMIFNIDDENRFIGKPIFQLDRSSLLCKIYEERESTPSFSREVEINNKVYNLIYNRIINNNRLFGYVLLFIDITKEKQLQLQRQEFASNVSHELKTPLQSIIGRAELIENGIVRPNDLQDFGLKIRTEGQALLNMINDIMFLSKVESGVKAKTESFNIKGLAQSVVDNLKEKASKRQVSVILESVELEINFVSRYMMEILNNLIDNAIKYNKDSGSVKCVISNNQENLYISVSDNGIGIPAEDVGRIFERFFCVDRSHSNKDSTGLGLTIVKHIVEECKGHISVESKLNEGTTFSVSLPLHN